MREKLQDVLQSNVKRDGTFKCKSIGESAQKINSANFTESKVSCKTNTDFEIIPIGSDGNCLFSTLSCVIYETQDMHTVIRKRIVEYVKNHWVEEKATLDASCVEYHYVDVDHYVSVMGADKTYGTDFELGIFSQIYEKIIYLWKLDDTDNFNFFFK